MSLVHSGGSPLHPMSGDCLFPFFLLDLRTSFLFCHPITDQNPFSPQTPHLSTFDPSSFPTLLRLLSSHSKWYWINFTWVLLLVYLLELYGLYLSILYLFFFCFLVNIQILDITYHAHLCVWVISFRIFCNYTHLPGKLRMSSCLRAEWCSFV